MGLDYIRKETGQSWRKRWDGGLDRLMAPTLFDLTMNDACHSLTADLSSGAEVKVGDSFIVQRVGDALVITDGLRAIGQIGNPSTDTIAAVTSACGYAEGIIQHVSLFGGSAEISLR